MRLTMMLLVAGLTFSSLASAEENSPGHARWELTGFQATHGLVLGLEACFALACESVTSWALAGFGGGAMGATLSWLLTSGDTSRGMVGALNSGASWGVAAGLSLALLDSSPSSIAARMMGAQLAGLGLGGLLGVALKPTPEQVSLVNTFGLWAGVVAFLVGNAFQWRPGIGLGPVIASAVVTGFGGGVVLARFVPVMADRTFAINVAGLLGSLAGIGVALLLQGAEPSNGVFFGCVLAGAALGVGLTGFGPIVNGIVVGRPYQ